MDVPTLLFGSILTAAIKFSHPGQEVKIVTETEGRHLRIKVCDQGLGMNEKLLRQVQDSGHVVGRPGTTGEKGSGLGLVLVKQMVKNNGGVLRFESAVGEGTRAILEFPLSI